MMATKNWRSRCALGVFVVLVGVLMASAQSITATKKRVIVFPDWAVANDDEDAVLDVVEIRVGGKKIAFNTPFEAGDDWLKTVTLEIENVSNRPLSMIGLGAGLFESLDDSLGPNESFKYGINWTWDIEKEPWERPFLKPGSAVTLNCRNIRSTSLEVLDKLDKKDEGNFCKLYFAAPVARFDHTKEILQPKVQFSLRGFH